MTIPPATDEVTRLLDALEAFAEEASLPPKAAHRLSVVIEELAANVVMHGSSGPGAATFVAVTVRQDGNALVATIEDDGRAFDPLVQAAPDTDAALEDRDIGGLGVHFVQQMTRTLDYSREDGRNRLVAVLDLAG
ncbi:ATP-binding protein [Roseomonas frigidaquae]|uniref:ATP-binding protein n=1 Tax=Falsiroseomonas frigidaquae TaxID=487318 RepID=A0ABX1F6C7_9PROT|nr:ATP-binding protein [Falsiroseomonas frigidaquae]NKE47842.1 ATP-binding protein [Falsiroseomonas frigidaquae]